MSAKSAKSVKSIGKPCLLIWQEEFKRIKSCPQRQDSLNAQLSDLITIANKLGFYDAADYLHSVLK